jgi:uncharacterized protein
MGRVQQRDWARPEAGEWSAAIDDVVTRTGGDVVLVAHSCGVVAVAHWAARFETRIHGAFLVAPPDPDRADLEAPVRAFTLPDMRTLPFPSLLVASEDDPYCDVGRARAMAIAWGAEFVSAGAAGHLNTASGHGPWPEGRALLDDFCRRIRR